MDTIKLSISGFALFIGIIFFVISILNFKKYANVPEELLLPDKIHKNLKKTIIYQVLGYTFIIISTGLTIVTPHGGDDCSHMGEFQNSCSY